jgi:hypothetical protein
MALRIEKAFGPDRLCPARGLSRYRNGTLEFNRRNDTSIFRPGGLSYLRASMLPSHTAA